MSGTVLIIEDEPSIADTIVYALEGEGFTTLRAGTGSEGLSLLAASDVHLIVLDVGLPDTNGFELCKQVRRHHSTPIIFLTARNDEIDRVVGLEIGADDYVTKPFSPRELAARVKAVLRRVATRPAESALPVEPEMIPSTVPFEVDEARCLIRFFGEDLQLSRYEFRLLKIFVNRPGWVFSREKLMELAWDEPESSMDRTVDAHIKSLRAKLRAVRDEEDPIRTHRGLGYSLKESF